MSWERTLGANLLRPYVTPCNQLDYTKIQILDMTTTIQHLLLLYTSSSLTSWVRVTPPCLYLRLWRIQTRPIPSPRTARKPAHTRKPARSWQKSYMIMRTRFSVILTLYLTSFSQIFSFTSGNMPYLCRNAATFRKFFLSTDQWVSQILQLSLVMSLKNWRNVSIGKVYSFSCNRSTTHWPTYIESLY